MKLSLSLVSLVLGATSINAQAELQNYTYDGIDLVYSTYSDVSWTKDANLLGTWMSNGNYQTVVDNIIARLPQLGSYQLSNNDFDANGLVTWYGAVAFTAYLNATHLGGTGGWHLPSVVFPVSGGSGNSLPVNGSFPGEEFNELVFRELNGEAHKTWPTDPHFINQQNSVYWTDLEAANPLKAYAWATIVNTEGVGDKSQKFFAWALHNGKLPVATIQPPIPAVPEPGISWLMASGLALLGWRKARSKS